MTLDELARRAREGDQPALEALAAELKDDIYGLAMRMLSHPVDAEDATQEILIKIVTHLGQFRGESAFRTWAWSIASRHLLRFRKGIREAIVKFQMVEAMIREGEGHVPDPRPEAEALLLAEEVKIGCTCAMLLSLDRDQRITYVLSEIFGLSGEEAAEILAIHPSTFRKRLQRARARLVSFMKANCGLVNPDQPCRCRRQIDVNLRHGTVDPAGLLFATHPTRQPPRLTPAQRLREANEIERAAAVFRSHPDYAAPDRVTEGIRSLLASGRYRMFDA
jgi:RNA polymerase sigma factor (sigma-70 family)